MVRNLRCRRRDRRTACFCGLRHQHRRTDSRRGRIDSRYCRSVLATLGPICFRRNHRRGRKSPRWPPTLSIRGVAFQHPLTPKDPQHPGTSTPTKVPVPVVPPDPQHPGHAATRTIVSRSATAVAENPRSCLPVAWRWMNSCARRVVGTNAFAIEQKLFPCQWVVSPSFENGVVNYEHRRSRVLTDLPRHEEVMFERIKTVLPQVLQKLGMPEFEVASVEAQITASNDGDYFHFHCETAAIRSRPDT